MLKTYRATCIALMLLALAGCGDEQDRPLTLPEPEAVAAWFGEGTEARITGNLLEIRGTIDPQFLERGGSLWARSAPYFYLFNVHVRQLLQQYPDLAAVRAVVEREDGTELARATVHRHALNVYQWEEAVRLASLAQREGTEHPRWVERLTRYGEDYTEYEYAGR